MCDTFVALGNSTPDGKVLFAKNSDRDPNEAQAVEIIAAADHAPGSLLKCTYLSIPQVEHTQRVLLSRPFWLWGAEMGANEHGVVIGNEAVFSKVAREKKPGLIGMDLLRLGLERSTSAHEALDVIITLLEKYGQGGNCGFSHAFYYDNSFLIADRTEAWVLETAGRQWAAVKVKDVRSISNALTIGSEWDMASANLVSYAVQRGWCKNEKDFDFARCYSDLIYTNGGAGRPRQVCTSGLLAKGKGNLTPEAFLRMLRTHNHGAQAGVEGGEGPSGRKGGWSPDRAILGAQVCMHTGWGPARESNTAGSLVARLGDPLDEYWVTGTSTPCTGIFKPIWLDAGLPDLGPTPGATYDGESLWWKHELLHREVLRDYALRLGEYAQRRDALEKEFLDEARGADIWSREKRLQYSAECFSRAETAEAEWLQAVLKVKPERKPRFYYRLAWMKFNRSAGMSDLSRLTWKKRP